MLRTMLVLALSVLAPVVSFADEPFSHHDGSPEGKKSIGGSGPMIRFDLGDAQTVKGLKLHASRYGLPKAPDEKILVYFLSDDQDEVLATRMIAYSKFQRGEQEWVTANFKPVENLSKFWVAVDFRAHQTKGVYVSYDTSTKGKSSRVGLPGLESKPTDFGGDWMIEVVSDSE